MARSKKITPGLLLLTGIAGFFVVSAVAKAAGESARSHLLRYGFAPGPQKVSMPIPPGKKWLVQLRNGDRTLMSSNQLQNALNAKAVKTYQEVPLGFVGPGGETPGTV